MVSQQAAASSKDIKHPHTQQDLQVDAPPSEQSKEKPCSKGKISTEGFTSVPLASTCNSYIFQILTFLLILLRLPFSPPPLLAPVKDPDPASPAMGPGHSSAPRHPTEPTGFKESCSWSCRRTPGQPLPAQNGYWVVVIARVCCCWWCDGRGTSTAIQPADPTKCGQTFPTLECPLPPPAPSPYLLGAAQPPFPAVSREEKQLLPCIVLQCQLTYL